MAVCWLSARTCNLLPRFCRGRALARRCRPFVFPGVCHPEPGRLSLANGGEGSAFPFSRHSFTLLALSLEGSEVEGPLIFTIDGRPTGRRPATRPITR